MDLLNGFNGDVVEILIDVVEELKNKNLKFDIIGIYNIVDCNEIKIVLEKFFVLKEG